MDSVDIGRCDRGAADNRLYSNNFLQALLMTFVSHAYSSAARTWSDDSALMMLHQRPLAQIGQVTSFVTACHDHTLSPQASPGDPYWLTNNKFRGRSAPSNHFDSTLWRLWRAIGTKRWMNWEIGLLTFPNGCDSSARYCQLGQLTDSG